MASSKFSSEVIAEAQRTEKEYGVPASVTLAQYALESGYGASGHAINHNNYFGMTGSNNGRYYMSGGRRWQEFSSMAESFTAHAKLLAGSIYSPLTAGTTTPEEYIDAISETYAPASDGNENYAGKLKSIINNFNLKQYDTGDAFKLGSGEIYTGTNNISFKSPNLSAGGKNENDDPSMFSKEYWTSLLGKVVKFIVLLGLAVLGFILIMRAFNIKIPVKGLGAEDMEDMGE